MKKKINLTKFKYIFFDFDGVIKDSVNIKGYAFKKLFNIFGENIAIKVYNHHMENGGMSRFEKIPIYLSYADQKINDALILKFLNNFSEIVCQRVIDSNWIIGADTYLSNNYLKQTFVLITATPQSEIEFILNKLGIKNFFYKVYGAPQKKNESIKRFNIENNLILNDSNSIVIGDSKIDYEAAKCNNLPFLMIGKNSFETWQIDVNNFFQINNFSELYD